MAMPSDQTVIDPEADVEFSPEQHRIWTELYARQAPQVQKYACREYLSGAENLKLPPDQDPVCAVAERAHHAAHRLEDPPHQGALL